MEIVFSVNQEGDGGFVAECLSHDIFTEGDGELHRGRIGRAGSRPHNRTERRGGFINCIDFAAGKGKIGDRGTGAGAIKHIEPDRAVARAGIDGHRVSGAGSADSGHGGAAHAGGR